MKAGAGATSERAEQSVITEVLSILLFGRSASAWILAGGFCGRTLPVGPGRLRI
jgi:hypothetical protein